MTSTKKHGHPPVRLFGLLSVIVLGLLLASCGGSDSPSSRAGPSGAGSAGTTTTKDGAKRAAPSKAAYVARADQACKRVQTRQTALRMSSKDLPFSKLSPTLRKQSRLAYRLARTLDDLGTPTGDAKRLAAFTRSVRDIGLYSKALAGSIAANHATPARHLAQKLVNARKREHTLGQGYGFKVCANGDSY